MRLKTIALAISAGLFITTSANAASVDLTAETTAYKTFVEKQMDNLLVDTQRFASLLKNGDLVGAKALYPIVRMYYERSEPIAESFGELDPKIDARLADLAEEAKTENNTKAQAEKSAYASWTGFHKIEKILWLDNTTKGTETLADQLVNDIKELRAKIPTATVTGELMVTGAVDLLNEVSTSKITGEEDIFSHTDLFDFKANVEGAEKIFEIFKPKLVAKQPKLAKEIQARFTDVNNLLAQYNLYKKEAGKFDYIGYDKLSKADIKALAEAVNKLGEPLAQMGVILK